MNQDIWLKHKSNSKWTEEVIKVDAIRIEVNGNIFEIFPTKSRLGAFTIKCVTDPDTDVGLIARNESVEVHFSSPEGVEVC